jgi:hypothetical protein
VSELPRGPGGEPPEDRLGDLGSRRRGAPSADSADEDGRSAADRLAELDVTHPEEEEEARPAGPPPRPSGIYSWVIGVAFLIVVVLAAISTLPDAGEGLRGPQVGRELPDFAAPLATGGSGDEANVKQEGSGGGGTEACDVREADALNICTVRRQKPLVITFAFTRGADCEPALDVVERVRGEFPQVAFVGVFSGEEREKVAELARERNWGFPIAVDPDGAVTNLYGVGGCPTTTFAYRGGEVRENDLGGVTEDELRGRVRDLLRAQAVRSR